MKFIDEAKIQVHAGKGGDGSAAFRREKFVPRGGPSGGDGGRGGSVWAIADRNINTLVDYRFARIHRAEDGVIGRGADKYGRGGEDIVLRMPVGTLVRDEDGSLLADLATHGQRALLAKGGQGGLGNLVYAVRQSTGTTFVLGGGSSAWQSGGPVELYAVTVGGASRTPDDSPTRLFRPEVRC